MACGKTLGWLAFVGPALAVAGAAPPSFDFAAEVLALRDVRVPAEVAGRVVQRPEDETIAVKADAVVVALDDVFLAAAARAARANTDRAKAQVEWAEKEYGRVARLFQRKTVGESEFDQAALKQREARTGLIAAEALAEEAERRLARTKIRAPFDGKLVRVFPERGEYLQVGATAFRIVDDAALRIITYVPAARVSLLAVGQKVRVAPERAGVMLPVLEAKVFSIAPAAEGQARTIRVEARARDASRRWRPGMTARLLPPAAKAGPDKRTQK
ncbi:MAG: efflux RND transporter periplasmic adaptor subunit [Planctomycetota bacterium]|jgi:membrane fusion protein (multidrug efflux system)